MEQRCDHTGNLVVLHLKKGEILVDIDVEEEVELTSQEKLDNMLTEMVPGEAAAPSDDEGQREHVVIKFSNIREAAVERMRGVAELSSPQVLKNDDED